VQQVKLDQQVFRAQPVQLVQLVILDQQVLKDLRVLKELQSTSLAVLQMLLIFLEAQIQTMLTLSKQMATSTFGMGIPGMMLGRLLDHRVQQDQLVRQAL
jgi:hypothetical protein